MTARLIFTSREHAALNRNYVNTYLWRPALQKADVPATREDGFHALRHFFASALLHDGVDIRALAEYLGHTDPGFTLRVYAHLMPTASDRMRKAVDGMLSGEAGGPATGPGQCAMSVWPGQMRYPVSSRSTSRTRAGAGAAGSGQARANACSPARSRSGPG